MKTRPVLLILVVLGLLGVAVAQAREAARESVPNWHAPSFWTPTEASPGAAAEEARTGLRTLATATTELPFIALPPCRVADTRGNGFTGAYGPPSIAANTTRTFVIFGQCGVPNSAAAVSFNFTALDVSAAGDLRVFPAGVLPPLVSTLNYNANTPNIANAAVVPLGNSGGITVQADAATINLVIDVNGFYGGPTGNGNNVFLGPLAGNATMTGDRNIGVGLGALSSVTTGYSNTAVGTVALIQDAGGFHNTAVGDSALAANTEGSANTAVGLSALGSCTGGGSNTAIGWKALFKNTDGNSNVAVGGDALFNNTSGLNNVAIGYLAADNLTSGSNNIHIGNRALSSESNTIRIGTGGIHTKFFVAGVRNVTTVQADALPVMIDGLAQLGTASSSRKGKRDIADVGEESAAIFKLRPVSFYYRTDTVGYRQYGLIAEEVAEVMPDLVQYSDEGEPQTVRYHFLPALLLNELQNQQRTIQKQNEIMSALEARLARLEARLPED